MPKLHTFYRSKYKAAFEGALFCKKRYGTVLAAILDDDNDGGQIDEVRTDTVTYSGAPVDMETCRQQVLASTLTLYQSGRQIMPNLH